MNNLAALCSRLGDHTRERELWGQFREIRLTLSDVLALFGWLSDESSESDL